MQNRKFCDLDPASFTDKTIILDVDGTLLADSHDTIAEPELRTIRELARTNVIYLCSNTHDTARIEALAHTHNVHALPRTFSKPDVRVVGAISDKHLGQMVVIGDKYLTDGVLAARLKVPFIRVARIQRRWERPTVYVSYLLDACIGKLVYERVRTII